MIHGGGEFPFFRVGLAGVGKEAGAAKLAVGVALGVGALARQQIGDAIQVHARLDPVRNPRVRLAGGQLGMPGGVGDHQGEVAAGRAANHADVVAINLVPVGVFAQETHAVLAIVQVGRPFVWPFLQILDTGTHVARLRQGRSDVKLARRRLVAAGPAAAMNDDHGRRARICRTIRRQVKVQLLCAPGRQVGHVPLNHHSLRRRPQRGARVGLARRCDGRRPGAGGVRPLRREATARAKPQRACNRPQPGPPPDSAIHARPE